jgi:hypothetical protein
MMAASSIHGRAAATRKCARYAVGTTRNAEPATVTDATNSEFERDLSKAGRLVTFSHQLSVNPSGQIVLSQRTETENITVARIGITMNNRNRPITGTCQRAEFFTPYTSAYGD